MESDSSAPVKTVIRRKNLTLEEKIEVLEHIERGEKHRDIARIYGVARPTIGYISRDRAKIRTQYELLKAKHPNKKSKRFSNAEDSMLENILFNWFTEKRAAGIHVGGNLLKQKALQINDKFVHNPKFAASAGWLARFRERHGIGQSSIQQETSPDGEGSNAISEEFRNLIEKEGFDNNHIYNADETVLQWKELPLNTSSKDRVTVMTCANASGKHKIPLLVIGQNQKPHCFEGRESFPLVYTSQRNSCMDANIFRFWYTTVFLPEIKKTIINETEKFLLLIDNAPCHPEIEELNAIDPCCMIIFFPQNISSVIQPMDQGVIVTMKRHYKRMYLQELLLDKEAEGPEKCNKFFESWNLLNCIRTLCSAWDRVSETTLANAWSNLTGEPAEFQLELNIQEICQLATRALNVPVSVQEITQWLDNDRDYCCWEDQTMEGIDSAATHNIEFVDIQAEIEEESEDATQVGTDPTTQTSALNAYNGSKHVYEWLQTQPDSTAEELLSAARLRYKIGEVIAAQKLTM